MAPSLTVARYFGEALSQSIFDATGLQTGVRIFMVSGATEFGSQFVYSSTSSVEILEPEIVAEYSPPVISSGSGDCHTYTFEVNDPERIAALQLDPSASDNVVKTFSPSLPSSNVKVTIILRDAALPGKFKVIATNSRGKSASKEYTLIGGSQLEFYADGTNIVRDTLIAMQRNCRTVDIVNPGNDTVRIDRLFMQRNIEISLPSGGRFDVIPPKGRVSVVVCYSPARPEEFTDTLIVESECALLKRPFVILGKPELLFGNERCSVGIQGEYLRLGSPPYPNPASSIVTLTVPSSLQNVWIEDALGHTVASNYQIKQGISSFEYTFNTVNLPNGLYGIVVRTDNIKYRCPVFILH